jgi:iron complex transport system permease protein
VHSVEAIPRRRDVWRLPALIVLVVLGMVLAGSVVLSTAFGAEPLPPSLVLEVFRHRLAGELGDRPYDAIVWQIRVSRALLGVLVGAGLAVAGAAIQTLVRNPLAGNP